MENKSLNLLSKPIVKEKEAIVSTKVSIEEEIFSLGYQNKSLCKESPKYDSKDGTIVLENSKFALDKSLFNVAQDAFQSITNEQNKKFSGIEKQNESPKSKNSDETFELEKSLFLVNKSILNRKPNFKKENISSGLQRKSPKRKRNHIHFDHLKKSQLTTFKSLV